MRLSTKTLLLAAAVAVLAVSCSSGRVVANVDDATIRHGSVMELRTTSEGSEDIDGDAYRADLTNLIYLEAQKSAAARGYGLSDLDDPDAIAQKIANPTDEEAPVFESVRSNPERTEATVEAVAEQFIIRDAIAEELVVDLDLASIYESSPEMLFDVCGRHILTTTQEEAAEAKARVEAGEDFGSVADEVSLDTFSAGGELPCPQPAGDYVPEFGKAAVVAPIGEMTEPVQTQYGWHIILIEERSGPGSLDEFTADPMSYLHPSYLSDAWIEWVNAAIEGADISVKSQVGTWAPESHGILPPPAE